MFEFVFQLVFITSMNYLHRRKHVKGVQLYRNSFTRFFRMALSCIYLLKFDKYFLPKAV